ncbi:MAG: hypothetical protein ACREN7_02010 [Candidatus Dormibacteria bacterium]
MSLPAGLPKPFFVDRSLGRIKVPRILRAAGLQLVTLAEHYGIPADEAVADVDWLQLAGTNSWPVLVKDAAIITNVVERRALEANQVQCFCLASQGLPAYRMAAWYLNSLEPMAIACQAPGPFIYRVGESGLIPTA